MDRRVPGHTGAAHEQAGWTPGATRGAQPWHIWVLLRARAQGLAGPQLRPYKTSGNALCACPGCRSVPIRTLSYTSMRVPFLDQSGTRQSRPGWLLGTISADRRQKRLGCVILGRLQASSLLRSTKCRPKTHTAQTYLDWQGLDATVLACSRKVRSRHCTSALVVDRTRYQEQGAMLTQPQSRSASRARIHACFRHR